MGRQAIERHIDPDAWASSKSREADYQHVLDDLLAHARDDAVA